MCLATKDIAGNVGIGTISPVGLLQVGTSPVQKLHVEGQCVTGDTLLPIVRIMDKSTIQYIPITEVKPGDYVLSLNEETGKIEPHRIKGLLDMGVKPVFRLTTASGRTIRTTGNHPYLVYHQQGSTPTLMNLGFSVEGNVVLSESLIPQFKWVKVAGLSVGDKIVVPRDLSFGIGKDDSKINQYNHKEKDVKENIDIHNLLFSHTSYCPQINHQGKNTAYNIKDKQIHSFLPALLANLADTVINAEVMAMPPTRDVPQRDTPCQPLPAVRHYE